MPEPYTVDAFIEALTKLPAAGGYEALTAELGQQFPDANFQSLGDKGFRATSWEPTANQRQWFPLTESDVRYAQQAPNMAGKRASYEAMWPALTNVLTPKPPVQTSYSGSGFGSGFGSDQWRPTTELKSQPLQKGTVAYDAEVARQAAQQASNTETPTITTSSSPISALDITGSTIGTDVFPEATPAAPMEEYRVITPGSPGRITDEWKSLPEAPDLWLKGYRYQQAPKSAIPDLSHISTEELNNVLWLTAESARGPYAAGEPIPFPMNLASGKVSAGGRRISPEWLDPNYAANEYTKYGVTPTTATSAAPTSFDVGAYITALTELSGYGKQGLETLAKNLNEAGVAPAGYTQPDEALGRNYTVSGEGADAELRNPGEGRLVTKPNVAQYLHAQGPSFSENISRDAFGNIISHETETIESPWGQKWSAYDPILQQTLTQLNVEAIQEQEAENAKQQKADADRLATEQAAEQARQKAEADKLAAWQAEQDAAWQAEQDALTAKQDAWAKTQVAKQREDTERAEAAARAKQEKAIADYHAREKARQGQYIANQDAEEERLRVEAAQRAEEKRQQEAAEAARQKQEEARIAKEKAEEDARKAAEAQEAARKITEANAKREAEEEARRLQKIADQQAAEAEKRKREAEAEEKAERIRIAEEKEEERLRVEKAEKLAAQQAEEAKQKIQEAKQEQLTSQPSPAAGVITTTAGDLLGVNILDPESVADQPSSEDPPVSTVTGELIDPEEIAIKGFINDIAGEEIFSTSEEEAVSDPPLSDFPWAPFAYKKPAQGLVTSRPLVSTTSNMANKYLQGSGDAFNISGPQGYADVRQELLGGADVFTGPEVLWQRLGKPAESKYYFGANFPTIPEDVLGGIEIAKPEEPYRRRTPSYVDITPEILEIDVDNLFDDVQEHYMDLQEDRTDEMMQDAEAFWTDVHRGFGPAFEWKGEDPASGESQEGAGLAQTGIYGPFPEDAEGNFLFYKHPGVVANVTTGLGKIKGFLRSAGETVGGVLSASGKILNGVVDELTRFTERKGGRGSVTEGDEFGLSIKGYAQALINVLTLDFKELDRQGYGDIQLPALLLAAEFPPILGLQAVNELNDFLKDAINVSGYNHPEYNKADPTKLGWIRKNATEFTGNVLRPFVKPLLNVTLNKMDKNPPKDASIKERLQSLVGQEKEGFEKLHGQTAEWWRKKLYPEEGGAGDAQQEVSMEAFLSRHGRLPEHIPTSGYEPTGEGTLTEGKVRKSDLPDKGGENFYTGSETPIGKQELSAGLIIPEAEVQDYLKSLQQGEPITGEPVTDIPTTVVELPMVELPTGEAPKGETPFVIGEPEPPTGKTWTKEEVDAWVEEQGDDYKGPRPDVDETVDWIPPITVLPPDKPFTTKLPTVPTPEEHIEKTKEIEEKLVDKFSDTMIEVWGSWASKDQIKESLNRQLKIARDRNPNISVMEALYRAWLNNDNVQRSAEAQKKMRDVLPEMLRDFAMEFTIKESVGDKIEGRLDLENIDILDRMGIKLEGLKDAKQESLDEYFNSKFSEKDFDVDREMLGVTLEELDAEGQAFKWARDEYGNFIRDESGRLVRDYGDGPEP